MKQIQQNMEIQQTQQTQKVKQQNRLYSLPSNVLNCIYEYDDTWKTYFNDNILFKSKISNDYTVLEKFMHPKLNSITQQYYFYNTILDKKYKDQKYNKIICKLISTCILTVFHYISVPFPHDLKCISYNHDSKVGHAFYEYENGKYYFIFCKNISISKFLPRLLKCIYKKNINILYYKNIESIFSEEHYILINKYESDIDCNLFQKIIVYMISHSYIIYVINGHLYIQIYIPAYMLYEDNEYMANIILNDCYNNITDTVNYIHSEYQIRKMIIVIIFISYSIIFIASCFL